MIEFRATALICSCRPHGETAVVARLLTHDFGLVAVFVAGGRGRLLRPVLIPGNRVAADIRARAESQLPYARIESETSRAPWLGEPLPAAAINWLTALTATVLPERHPYPVLYEALDGLLEAICVAPSARGWSPAQLAYEALILGELGYGAPSPEGTWLERFDASGAALSRYLLADRRGDVMAARAMLRERLARIGG